MCSFASAQIFYMQKLLHFIFAETKIPMTAPVTVRIEPGEGPNCESTFTVSFFIGNQFRDNPPKPTNPDVYLNTMPEMTVYAR